MDWPVAIALGCALAAAVACLALMFRAGRDRAVAAAEARRMAEMAESLSAAQHQLAGRMSLLADSAAASQAEFGRTVMERLDAVSRQLGETLEQSAARASQSMSDLQARLAVIDQAQKSLAELSGQMMGLQDILSNKQARGAFGELQLADLVQAALPPNAYVLQHTFSNGRRCDCLIRLPLPPGPIAVDAKFPLESYRALVAAQDDSSRALAGRAFATDILKHVRDIAERYILPGETAESALMFLPSEAVYAELHARFPEVVEKSWAARVWIVSPTTMMATLNTVRAVLKDARMREQAGAMQKQVMLLLEDVRRLDERVKALGRHVRQTDGTLQEIGISTGKIMDRAGRIGAVQLEVEVAAGQAEIGIRAG